MDCGAESDGLAAGSMLWRRSSWSRENWYAVAQRSGSLAGLLCSMCGASYYVRGTFALIRLDAVMISGREIRSVRFKLKKHES